MGQVNDDINLEQLKVLKQVFEEADEDGSGELDIDEFVEKLGPHLGKDLTRAQITQLFMKIDADAGGTVDWEEFTNYMFLERAQTGSEGVSENWKLFPMDFRDRNDPSVTHRGNVDRMYYVDAIDKYVSCSRDGTFRLWNGTDLRHFRTVYIGSSWITDALYMPAARKLVFTTVDRAVSYYEANRGSFELSGRVYASGNMGVPQCLTLVTNEAGEQVVYGDSKGAVTMLLCGTREWPARDMISTHDHQDYITVHNEHTDWVTDIDWVPEIGLVSSSLDSHIKIYDFVREKVINTCTHHVKGVHSFLWCRAYSLFASCGQERDILLWQGNTTRRIGELTGHTSSVTHVALDEHLNHVFSLSLDKVIKVWDLRNHRCLQTVNEEDWMKPEESHPHCLMYDPDHRRVVTAASKPYVWVHKLVAQDRTGHMEPVRGALYNATFDVVVSADEAGTVCVWNIATGAREGRFTKAHGDSKMTAMSFDKNERRLCTAANDGSVKMWNFNNGSLLRTYAHDEEAAEVSTVLFAKDEKRGADAVYASGWNAKVFVWEDADDDCDVLDNYRCYEGHHEDILHMAACSERGLLATGDYEGRIYVWNLFTGEKRMWLCHRSERYETSVDRLQWVICKKKSTTLANTLPGGAGNGGAAPPPPLLLLSCGGDGLMRVWHIGTAGKLLCTLPAAQGRLEQVSAICCDVEYDHVIIGDTAGHIRIWGISGGIDLSSSEACAASFKQRCHWRGHKLAVNSVAIIPSRSLVVAGSKDTNVSVWTFDGGLVGTFGDDTWKIEDRMTWQDPDGEERKPPMGEADGLYLQVNDPDSFVFGSSGPPGHEGGAHEDACTYRPVQMANMILADSRLKAREASMGKNAGLHSLLRVHDLDTVPDSVSDLLHHHSNHSSPTTKKPVGFTHSSTLKHAPSRR